VNLEQFQGWVEDDEDPGDYLERMKASGWGGELEIKAFSELYERPVEIWVATLDGAMMYRRYVPSRGGAPSHDAATIKLSYYGGTHYDYLVSQHPTIRPGRPIVGVLEDNVIEMVAKAKKESCIQPRKHARHFRSQSFSFSTCHIRFISSLFLLPMSGRSVWTCAV
jgi:hypothetical protein